MANSFYMFVGGVCKKQEGIHLETIRDRDADSFLVWAVEGCT